MYFIIMGLPLAFVFAAVQVYFCKKAKSIAIKLLPIFAGAGALLLAAFIRGENLLADAVYGFFGQGIFAVIVLLWIFGAAAGAGSVIGWIIFIIRAKAKNSA